MCSCQAPGTQLLGVAVCGRCGYFRETSSRSCCLVHFGNQLKAAVHQQPAVLSLSQSACLSCCPSGDTSVISPCGGPRRTLLEGGCPGLLGATTNTQFGAPISRTQLGCLQRAACSKTTMRVPEVLAPHHLASSSAILP